MKICVLSGRYPATSFLSSENHRIYCSYHGYYYINCNWPTQAQNPYLHKFNYIDHYLTLFDFVFWIDDDAFFLDVTKPLNCFIPEHNIFLSICHSPDNKKIKTVFSSGSFMISSSLIGKLFVRRVLETNLEVVKKWWTPEKGFFTNGDQDIMIYLYLTSSEFQNKIKFFNHHAFNSRLKDLIEGDRVFLIHITGTSNHKLKTYKKLQSFLNVDRTLLNIKLHNDFKVIDTKSIFYKLKVKAYTIKKFLKI